jgi:hypothetical protein
MDKIVAIYHFFKTEKKKERFDIILEPLQALTQLSALAFCPIGSKLTISNNLLYIQIPGWGQGLMRSFNNDKRDDLFYLFNVIIRFNTFYNFLKTNNENEEDAKLFKLVIKLAKQGIDNLLLTYSTIDQPSLLHTLHMYRTLLDNPELVIKSATTPASATHAYATHAYATPASATPATTANKNGNIKSNKKENNNESASGGDGGSGGGGINEIINIMEDTNSKKSINDVFIYIRKIYSQHERSILYHLLILMEAHPDQYLTYIDAINAAMNPINNQIKKWINDNIVY